ncbi:hypothetical protein F4556_000959 [Kitasatospora gansuensis]|uniref:DUF2510 domain-containing protein n=1 Tax=Kitasatospora gansuensis TaxID=258050 RepID=A0A7W7S7M1_9ACTN|nr:DUF2510 domain-containing protein [Kitasatospora gansuensis]MBB4945424.1 hypothetical protein [Kitasatospora gansuensis]
MSEQIPAGWYPDPQDTTTDPRPQRWWDGQGWTASTRPAPADSPEGPKVLEGEVLESGPTVRYPEPPPLAPPADAAPVRRKLPKPVLAAAAVAALAGLLVGSGVTYLAMDGRSDRHTVQKVRPEARPGGDSAEGGGGGASKAPEAPGGKGRNSGLAVDAVNRISLSIPTGWTGGTTKAGYAGLSIGSYTCASGSGECSLGGVSTGQLKGTDVKQAAEQDITTAAEESYGKIKSHEQLKSEPIAIDGRDGYLIRWKVDAPEGNDGYVQTVVFPTADGKALASVHLGFDIDDKAPKLTQMDKIVESIKAFTGQLGEGGGTRA